MEVGNKAIFLDRDGTINVEKGYLYKIEDFEFLNGVLEALRMLQKAGYKLIIITNQSGIARGYYTEEDYEKLTVWMLNELKRQGIKMDGIYYCPHHPNAKRKEYRVDCGCRKPKLGLFERAAREFRLDFSQCYAVGDKIRDCEICKVSGCKGFLIGKNEERTVISEVQRGNIKNVVYRDCLLDCAMEITKAGESCQEDVFSGLQV